MKLRILEVFLVGIYLSLANISYSSPILDQSLEPGDSINFKSGVGSIVNKAQTFTVGMDGLLSRIDIFVNKMDMEVDGDLQFDIRPTVNGVPVNNDSMALAILTVPKDDIMIGTGSFLASDFQWLSLDVSSFGIFVKKGDVFAIALASTGHDSWSDYRWGSYNNDSYPDGIQYIRNSDTGNTWTPGREDHYGEDHYDGCFRTYVDTTRIPPACKCDLYPDGSCDMYDWLLFGADWCRTDCSEPGMSCLCDLNDDGKCDMQDWLIFGEDWGRTDCPH